VVTPDALRASALGLVCGLGAVLAHAGVAGHAVGTGPALLLTALGLAAGPVLARRPTPARVLAGALTIQAAGHGLLSLAPTATHDAMPGMSGMTGMTGGHDVLSGGATMLVGHVVVALLTTLLALRADHAVRALVDATVARLLPPHAPTAPRPVARLPRPAPVVRRPSPLAAPAPAGPRAPPRSSPLPGTLRARTTFLHHLPQPA
jgi:hypothetical protein